MRIPEKGKPVMYTFKGSTFLGFSMGEYDVDGLCVSYEKECMRFHLITQNWQEVEIKPVVHVPEDMKPCYVWDNGEKPEIPHIRLSFGKIDSYGLLECYMPLDKRTKSCWKNWEEI